MSAQWTTTSASVALKWYLSIGSVTRPTSFYLGLSSGSADPDVGAFGDLAVTNYSRKTLSWSYSADVIAVNSAQIDFANLGTGSILGQGIFDASSGGNLLFWADLDQSFVFSTGHTISYPAGIIKVGLTL